MLLHYLSTFPFAAVRGLAQQESIAVFTEQFTQIKIPPISEGDQFFSVPNWSKSAPPPKSEQVRQIGTCHLRLECAFE